MYLLKFHPFLNCNQIMCKAKMVHLCYLSSAIGVKMHCVASCCKYILGGPSYIELYLQIKWVKFIIDGHILRIGILFLELNWPV